MLSHSHLTDVNIPFMLRSLSTRASWSDIPNGYGLSSLHNVRVIVPSSTLAPHRSSRVSKIYCSTEVLLPDFSVPAAYSEIPD